MASVNQIVTDRIIEKIEDAIKTGAKLPWQQPWCAEQAPMNYSTGKYYRGCNLWLLDTGEYITFKQICDEQKSNPNVKLRKGSKAHMVVYFTVKESIKNITDEVTGEVTQKESKIPILRYYYVYDIKDVDGLISRRPTIHYEHEPLELAESIINNYIDREKSLRLSFNSGEKACYRPLSDEISVPSKHLYKNLAEYYSTVFHECAHSTGHQTRLNRIKVGASFGSDAYSKEELTAEMAACILCSECGIDNTEAADNSVAYLKGWLAALKNDVTLLVSASSRAQKAADFILNKNTFEI